MDDLLVSVFDKHSNEWHDCGGVEIPSNVDDDLACLMAKGLVFNFHWTAGMVQMCIVREDASGPRVLLDEALHDLAGKEKEIIELREEVQYLKKKIKKSKPIRRI